MGGSALLSRVRAAYRHVPAVRTADVFNNQTVQSYTYLLRHGIITDELNHPPGAAQDVVVAPRSGRAYELIIFPKTRCWVLDMQQWHNVDERGSRFPHIASRQVGRARRVGSVWQLPVAETGHEAGRTDTLLIDAKTSLIKRLVFAGTGGHNFVDYKTLTQAPTFPVPRPLCRK